MNDLSTNRYQKIIAKEEEVDAYKLFTGVFDGNDHHIKMNITLINLKMLNKDYGILIPLFGQLKTIL